MQCVGQRLLRIEGLADDHEQRRFGTQPRQHGVQHGAVDIGNEVRTRTVDLYAQLYETLEARARARGGRMPVVAVLDKTLWKNHRRASWYRALMYCSSRGCPVVYVDPEEVDYRNGKLIAHGMEIDMVAFVSWELLINARAKLKKLFSAISDGAVEVYAGVSRSLLASYKTMFELLSSTAYRELFPAELANEVARHIPWTRALRERTTDRDGTTVELLPFVRDHREQPERVAAEEEGVLGRRARVDADLLDARAGGGAAQDVQAALLLGVDTETPGGLQGDGTGALVREEPHLARRRALGGAEERERRVGRHLAVRDGRRVDHERRHRDRDSAVRAAGGLTAVDGDRPRAAGPGDHCDQDR